MGMRGVYRETAPPDRSVHVESFDDYPGESIVTSMFSEEMGKTTLTATGHLSFAPDSRPDRQIRHGARGGAESYDRLGDLLGAEQQVPA
jgi:hypothetical protein